MALYRFYHVGIDGHFRRAETMTCASDTDALANGGAMSGRDDVAVEVWEGGRFVARVESPNPRSDERLRGGDVQFL
jgi:hypothetical protein